MNSNIYHISPLNGRAMCQFTYVDDTGNKQMNTPIPTQHQNKEEDISHC